MDSLHKWIMCAVTVQKRTRSISLQFQHCVCLLVPKLLNIIYNLARNSQALSFNLSVFQRLHTASSWIRTYSRIPIPQLALPRSATASQSKPPSPPCAKRRSSTSGLVVHRSVVYTKCGLLVMLYFEYTTTVKYKLCKFSNSIGKKCKHYGSPQIILT